MRLKELSNEDILKRILDSDTLREKFDNYIQESEMNYINDILKHFNAKCAEWSIGPYNQNYFKCWDAYEFVFQAREMVDMYGASDKTLRILFQVEKLRDTNLFEHYANKLASCIEADLCEYCKGIEDMSYDIYCRKMTPGLLDFCEGFAEYVLDDVMIDEDDRLYHVVYL